MGGGRLDMVGDDASGGRNFLDAVGGGGIPGLGSETSRTRTYPWEPPSGGLLAGCKFEPWGYRRPVGPYGGKWKVDALESVWRALLRREKFEGIHSAGCAYGSYKSRYANSDKRRENV
jgi:hypothetical protein